MSTDYYTDTPSEQKERLRKIKSRKHRRNEPEIVIEDDGEPERSTLLLPTSETRYGECQRPSYEKPFVCYDNTPIIFGKLKGKNHEILKQPEWANYCEWIIRQGSEFKFQGTRTYILENVNLE